jgi:DNA/RNA-binding domain of Phe-tRNA-synthetase-like protein
VNFTIDGKIFSCFPDMKLAVVVARDVDNQFPRPEIQTELRQSWISAGKAAQEYGNPQSHPRIKPWGEHFKALGVSRKEFPSSIEALVRRAGKGGEPMAINSLVDFYNSVSLQYLVPAGGFELDQLETGLELRFSREGDEFQALDDEAFSQVPAGEVAYADGARILTRHFIWRQSKIGLILPTSKNVLLVSEIPGQLEESLCNEVLASLVEGLRRYFQTAPAAYVMNATNLAIQL